MEQRIAVITGGSRGIGKATAAELLSRGDLVYSLARNPCELPGVRSLQTDLRDVNILKQQMQDIFKEHGRLDVLVNNAGIMEDALLGMISSEKLLEQFQINVFAMIEMTQMAARFMKRRKSGCIVNMASMVGVYGNAGQSVYSATKGAVISFTKSAAKELAPDGIRVNAVAPGIVKTELVEKVPAAKMEKRLEQIGMKRMGSAQEIAKAIAFLASEEASYISGQILGVDGCAAL